LSHPHEDHITDINRLNNRLPPAIILRQKYDWEKIKEPEGEYEILDTYTRWQTTYNQTVEEQPNWGMKIETSFCLSPSEARKIDENKFVNNSSIPVMIKYKGWKFFFPGDLEKDGWSELLKREEFKDALRGTDFFITAHHGHSSGYCKEIFDVMGRPYLNIVSTHKKDESVESAYSTPSCAKGVKYNDKTRYMLSTRHDGSIFINVSEEGEAIFKTRKLLDNI
jgi:beta-lactamase superfamily II metal-dependent hydrolase